ncbi:discoidin domain-containing protein [Clostridium sp. YIM B02515]|uniref:Discoidin domain-containing protein n=1 Tax=Clostridium rhizosphaerae TaxID=2803861 RepID=A0ABS1T9G8_9CLOT|nr:discoidin domain-containing protein [Clostridium rhizosphaerae]MBL4935998.1 discoidin domain-containing protein [Clostridium rhizosphaerae]
MGNEKFPKITALIMVLMLILSSFMIPMNVQAVETYSSEATNRVKMNFNTGWLFYRGDIKGAEASDFDDSYLEAVNLPHTARLEPKDWQGTTPCYQGIVWYRRHFTLDKSYSGRKIFIEFQCAMGNAEVWLNGTKLTTHYGGYTPFTVDLTDHINFTGENIISVRLDNSYDPNTPPGKPQQGLDFAYYGGIYRNVSLIVTDKLHVTDPVYANKVADGGVFVTYPEVSKSEATVQVKTNVKNEYYTANNCSIETTIVDTQGNVVAKDTSASQAINAGGDNTFVQTLKVQNPNLWSPNNPYLYTVHTTVKNGDTYVDDYKTRIGIRTIKFTADKGFFINGEKVLLSGVNRHQDYLYIGNAAPDSLQYADAKQIKDAGFNCVRTGHYPQSPAFLDACDELGIAVVEPTPGWQYFGGNTWQDRVVQNTQDEIRRDRNRPSVVLWESSINETVVPKDFAQRMYDTAHKEYPGDQCYVSADYSAYGKEIYDVNYKEVDTADKPLFTREWGDEWSEGASDTTGYRSARRYGEVDMINGCTSRQTALGGTGYFDWCGTNANPRISGYALWSFNDYNRGTETAICHSGIVDIDRYPKFNYYFLQSQRDPNIKLSNADSGPMVFIANNWTASSPKDVSVMSNCQQVKLYLNDRLIATNSPDTNVGVIAHPIFTFKNVPWEPGTLRAEGLIDGNVVATNKVNTPGAADHLSIEFASSGKEFVADGSDISMAYVTVRDKDGNIVSTAQDSISLNLSGPGMLVGNGDSRVKANPVSAEAGIAPVLIKSTLTAGKITLTATVAGLASGSAEITTIPYNGVLVPGGSDERNNPLKGENISFGKTVTVSSEQSDKGASFLNDLTESTSWRPAKTTTPQWAKVDLGANYNLTGAELVLDTIDTSLKYKIEVSEDNNNWVTVVDKTQNESTAQRQDNAFASNARYVRLTIPEFVQPIGISEFKIFSVLKSDSGDQQVEKPIDLALNKNATASSSQADCKPNLAVDADTATVWRANKAVPQWWQVDLGKQYDLSGCKILWGKDSVHYTYRIEVSKDGSTWNQVVKNQATGQNFLPDDFKAQGIQYLRIDIDELAGGVNELPAMRKVEVYWDKTNVAKGKKASSDSEQSQNPASSGNDGNSSTRWCADDGSEGHWWKVDLGDFYDISGTEAIWEVDGKAYKYKIEVSPDDENWTLKVDKTNNTSTEQVQQDTLTANSVRYVRITITGLDNTWASFYEFKVFGSKREKSIPNPNSIKIPQSQMSITATSEETSGEDAPASNALDGDINTFWHSSWSTYVPLPQSLTINLHGTYMINQLRYLPRQTSENGRITLYKTYVSMDGTNFTQVDMGVWENDTKEKVSSFTPVNASYVKLEAIEGANGYATAAEINVYKEPEAVITSINSVNVTTVAGTAPALPAKVTAVYSDKLTKDVDVTWNAIDASKYAKEGSFTVEGKVEGTDIKAAANVTVAAKPIPVEIESINPVNVTTEARTAPVLPAKVTAIYSDKSTKDVEVTWDAIDTSKYAKEGSFTVEGKVEGTEIKAAANVTVTAKPIQVKIESINPVNITTEAGTAPVLPAKVTAVYSDKSTKEVSVVWDAIDASKYAKEGNFTVEGKVEGTDIKAAANVTVTAKPIQVKIESINLVNVTTEAGTAPVLPEKVTAVYSDNTTKEVTVTWDAIDASKYAQEGSFTVNGTVEGTDIKAVANVTVTAKPTIVDKSALILAIKDTQAKLDAAVIGTAEGQYTKDAKDELSKAIKAAEEIIDNKNAAQDVIDSGTAALNKAINVFISRQLKVETKNEVNDASALVKVINTVADKSKIAVDITKNTIASKDVLNSIKGQDKLITFQKDGISWTINGKDLKNSTDKDIDLALKVVSNELKDKESKLIKDLVGKETSIAPFSFSYDGPLPGKFTIKVFVGKDFAGKEVNVCRYYEDKNTYEVVDTCKVDADGYISYNADHCSDYFVVEKSLLEGNSKNNDNTNNQEKDTSNKDNTTENKDATSNAGKLAKTGSPVDMTSLIVFGVVIMLSGCLICIRKRKTN